MGNNNKLFMFQRIAKMKFERIIPLTTVLLLLNRLNYMYLCVRYVQLKTLYYSL